ncbi:MAG: nucleotide exchange factor GrpE [Eubacteriaceae bacterium]
MKKEEVISEEIKEEFEKEDKKNINKENDENILEEEENENLEDISDDKVIKSKEEDYLNQLMRLQADFDNFRKRTVKEKEDTAKYALESFYKQLLPIIDNFERAIQSIEDSKINDVYTDGIKMVFTQLFDIMKNEGLEEIESNNVEFDPQYHHGVSVENNEEIEDNKIIEVYQKGYKLKDKVIRPAMVKICKK